MLSFGAYVRSLDSGSQASMSAKPPTTPLETVVIEKVESTPTPTPTTPPKPTQAPILAMSVVGSKYDLMKLANIAQSDHFYVDHILTKESGWCATKWNRQKDCPTSPTVMPTNSSGAYGLCQSKPASKMATVASDYMTNAVTQLIWCDQYAVQRYGGWAGAYKAWVSQGWW